MTSQEKTILETVLTELHSIKRGLPNGELKQIADNMKEMKDDFSELKYMLLNPEDGIVVRVNRNTEFRKDRELKIPFLDNQVKDLEELKSWKSGVVKALWIIFASLAAIVARLLIMSSTKVII
jgi:hypothetical protein